MATEDEKTSADMQRITVYVVQARNLPIYDVGPHAASDPYVKLAFGSKNKAAYKTATIRRDLNPVWNASFQVEGAGVFQGCDCITFDVFDWDRVSKDDFMGRCTIKTDQAPQSHYSTPVMWLQLVDAKGKAVKGKNGKNAELQIKVQYTLNAEDLNVRFFTHIMEFTIKNGKNLRNKEVIGKSDPYVKLEWGAQSYETKIIKNNVKEPVWNETAFIFVHENHMANFQAKLCVMDRDVGKDDQLGTGYLSAKEIFAGAQGQQPWTKDVLLREVPVGLDRGLLNFSKDSTYKTWGDLVVEIRLKPKDVVEREFYAALVKTFDANGDKLIDREEVSEMFAAFKIPNDPYAFFEKFDENKDGKLDESEVLKMLQNADFQGSELATQLMAVYLRGGLQGDFQRHLMSGFSAEHLPSTKVINVMDRRTGLLVQEFIPNYVWYSLKLMYNVNLGRALVQSKPVHKLLDKMSRKRGAKMDARASAAEIPGFIRQHNLDTASLHRKPEDFKTFNDFFARGMNVEVHRPLAHPVDEMVVVSPADCRLMCWNSILDSTKFWIKGSKFTLSNLCGANTKVNLKRYEGGSFVIARLAPQDYHRWHYPVSGKVVKIEPIDGALYTVNPIAVNKPVDVYTSNKRAVVELECGGKIGNCIMFVIAATMVGSYRLFKTEAKNPVLEDPVPLQVGDTVKRGDVAGEFRFGGSTILLLFEPNKVKFDSDIVRNVESKFETLMQVRNRIGRIQ